MGKGHLKNKRIHTLPRMEALERIGNIPIVEYGYETAQQYYNDLKKRNGLLNWYCRTAEGVLFTIVDTVQPAVRIIEGPLQRFDKLLCSSLDIVEQRVPQVYLPPESMINNTKEYMSDHLVRPVLKRADSVKQIGNAVLDSRVSVYAADRIEGALDVADKYVDRYLPTEEAQDQVDVPAVIENNDNEMKAVHTFHKGQRFSRKLKRRLTMRTLAEARALKKQSKEAIHVLLYAAELIATDPKQALQKAKELWAYLSHDEPENQARPQTIEELLVLITRESARRFVHVVNIVGDTAITIPSAVRELLHQLLDVTDFLLKKVHLDDARSKALNETHVILLKSQALYATMQIYTVAALERLAIAFVGRLESERERAANHNKRGTVSKQTYYTTRSNNNPCVVNNVNGVY